MRAWLTPLIVLCLPAPLIAQMVDDDPYVVKVEWQGVESLDASDIEEVLATEATRCRSILYAPICWVTSSHLFEAKHRLDREELQRDELRIRVFYFRRGWRDAQVRSEVTPDGDGVRVAFIVDEGAPTLLTNASVTQTDSVLDDGDLRRADLPDTGDPLDLVQLDSARLRLQAMLWERGYADAVIDDTAHVDDAGDVADLEIRIEPGKVATIGSIRIEGNEGVSDRTIGRLLGLNEGDIYRRSDVLEAQRNLYRTEIFRQALIQPPEDADSAKTLVVSIREAPFRAIRTGIGFTTTEFGQVEAGFTRYDWIGSARRLDLDAAVGNIFAPQLYGRSIFGSAEPTGIGSNVDDVYLDPTWRVSARVTQPWLFSPRNSLGIGVFAHRRSVPGIVVDRGYGADASVTHRVDENSPISLTYRFERTRVEAGQVYFCANFGICRPETTDALRSPHQLSPLGLTARVDRSDDELAPTRGWIAQIELEHASPTTFSDFAYNRASGELSHYRAIGRFTLAVHARGGIVRALASTDRAFPPQDERGSLLHPRKRFYAGGARSVRGYGESQLGPRILVVDPEELLAPDDTTATACTPASLDDGTCDPSVAPNDAFSPRPLGGNGLIEGSIELRFPLTETITGAVFLDAGRVIAAPETPAESRTAATPGFGIRYRSPIGPIRIDLGIRPRLVEELTVITQSGTGQEARLVQLDARRRYDPIGDSNGFLSKLFSRLQLHLAVGEAF